MKRQVETDPTINEDDLKFIAINDQLFSVNQMAQAKDQAGDLLIPAPKGGRAVLNEIAQRKYDKQRRGKRASSKRSIEDVKA